MPQRGFHSKPGGRRAVLFTLDQVIEYVRGRFGKDSVSQIATFNILKARSAVRDVGRVMGMPFGDVDRIAKLIPEDFNITVPQAVSDSPELKALVDGDDDVRQLVETASRLEGLARHCGVHAAGVVIAPEHLVNLVPLIKTANGEVCTQFNKDDVEALGLLKMDFLGLRTLTVIADAGVGKSRLLAEFEQALASRPSPMRCWHARSPPPSRQHYTGYKLPGELLPSSCGRMHQQRPQRVEHRRAGEHNGHHAS